MVHFTCDLCGKVLADSGEPRYVVKIESYPAFDPSEITEADLDADHMEAIAKLLQRHPDFDDNDLDVASNGNFRYDLCPACHGRFLKDPLNRETMRSLNFSEN